MNARTYWIHVFNDLRWLLRCENDMARRWILAGAMCGAEAQIAKTFRMDTAAWTPKRAPEEYAVRGDIGGKIYREVIEKAAA